MAGINLGAGLVAKQNPLLAAKGVSVFNVTDKNKVSSELKDLPNLENGATVIAMTDPNAADKVKAMVVEESQLAALAAKNTIDPTTDFPSVSA